MNDQVAMRLAVSNILEINVLDAGCGIGTSCRKLASMLPSAKFYGVNVSQGQVDYGHLENNRQGFGNRVELVKTDFCKIPKPDNHFDAAYAIESICYGVGPDKIPFILEMTRVLKKDGRLVIADGFKKHSRPLPEWFEKLHRKNLDYWAIKELPDIQLFTSRLRSMGFKIQSIEDISWNVAPSAFYLPFTAIKVFVKRLFSKNKNISKNQQNYPKAIWLTLFLGLFRLHFGYFIITANLNSSEPQMA